MNCPKCGHVSTVLLSRPHESGGIRRRRKCRECGFRWTTMELDVEAVRLVTEVADFLARTRAEPRGKKPANNPNRPGPHRHGYKVPAHLEADWLTLKKHGYTDDDAARAIGLPVRDKATK